MFARYGQSVSVKIERESGKICLPPIGTDVAEITIRDLHQFVIARS